MRLQHLTSKYKFLALAFAIPSALMMMVMIVGGYEPFGNDLSMLYSDMYHQYYPFFVAFRDALLGGESLQYSWSVGMGMDYLALIAYYLSSPLNLLCVLVPESLTLEFFSLLMPLKLSLASGFFAWFLYKTFDRNDLSISLFGSMYGLCAWALGYQWNVMWLDTFALLPLMALGTIWLLRDRKFMLYTVVLFLSIFSNYYIGFFVCIFVLLLFICWEVCRWPGFKRFCSDFGRIAVFTVIAIGMTAVIELPAFAGLQNTQSSVNSFPTQFRLNIAPEHTLQGLVYAMGEVASNMGGGLEPTFKEGLPNLYCGVGSMVLALLFLTSKEVRWRDKLFSLALLVFFIVSFIIRQLDYIWHGMHFTNMIPYRFSFLYSFVLLYMAYRAYLLRDRFKWWQLVLAAILCVDILCFSKDRTQPLFLLYNGGFLTAYLAALAYGISGKTPSEDSTEEEIADFDAQKRQKQQIAELIFTTAMALELIVNIVNFGLSFPATTVSDYPKGSPDTTAVIAHMKQREADSLFYRAETTHSQTLNDGALNGYHGVSAFTSSANVRVTEFMQALGYGAKNTYNRYCFEQSSPVANLFLNLKYMIDRNANVDDSSSFRGVYRSGNVALLENRYYLPLGFLADHSLSRVNWSETDRFSFQNELFSAAVGQKTLVWHMATNYQIFGDNVTVDQNSGYWYCKYSNALDGGAVIYTFTAEREGVLCLDLNVTDRNSYTVSKNGTQLYSESISLPQMIAACDVVQGDVVEVRLACKAGEDGSMTVKAAILDMDAFDAGYQILAASQLELDRFSTTLVSGSISCNRNGLLYTSVAQDGNWNVFVDGQQVEPTLIGDVMIGIYLTQGDHDIRLEYENRAFSYGWKISLACVLCLLIALTVYRPNRKGKYLK